MGIPEFVIKKLIVPGSFICKADHFSVKLLNSFAPATITRFVFFIDGKPVDGTLVKLSSMVHGYVEGSAINPESPISMPVGIEISIQVDTPCEDKPVKILATTKEVGDIEFSLTSGPTKKHKKSLKPGLFSILRKPKTARFLINPDESLGIASPFLYGHFIEHLERCIYDGIWTKDGTNPREDTLDLIRQLNPSIIRYPGGNFASGYHWEDGIGPLEKRPARHDAAWQAEESNQVGTDEFLRMCEQLQCEPYLVTNDGSGTPEEAARWVEYCNGSITTEQGARRAQNGHPEPYNVKYWGVGNEVWGPWQIGTTTANNYSSRLGKFIHAMRAIDPSIKIIAVGHNPLSDDDQDPATIWNQIVLKNAGDLIDYLSWHIYQPEKSGWQENYDQTALFKSVSAAHINLEEILLRVERQIRLYAPDRHIQQAVDEWNLWLPPIEKDVSMHAVTYTMRDALYVSSALVIFAKFNRNLGMANIAQLVNVLPLIQTNSETAIATAIFFPFVLFGQLHAEIVSTSSACASFNSEFLDTNTTAHTNVPYLDGIAGLDREKHELTVILINRYPLDRLKVDIKVPTSFSLTPQQSLILHAPEPGSYNSFRYPNIVRISDAPAPVSRDESWEVTLKPCSVSLIKFKYEEKSRT